MDLLLASFSDRLECSGTFRRFGSDNEAYLKRGLQCRLDPTAQKYAALGSLFLLEGKFSESIEMENKAIELNPNSYTAWNNLGAAYSWSGNNDNKALKAYRKSIDLMEVEHVQRP